MRETESKSTTAKDKKQAKEATSPAEKVDKNKANAEQLDVAIPKVSKPVLTSVKRSSSSENLTEPPEKRVRGKNTATAAKSKPKPATPATPTPGRPRPASLSFLDT